MKSKVEYNGKIYEAESFATPMAKDGMEHAFFVDGEHLVLMDGNVIQELDFLDGDGMGANWKIIGKGKLIQ